MTSADLRTVVFGYHTMGCLGFDALLRHGFDVRAVFTHRDDPREEVWWDSLAARAGDRGIPVHMVDKAEVGGQAFAAAVADAAPSFAFSFYFRHLIPEKILALAPRGAFNLHGSLLPRYRGRAPVNWVLVNGETETGVSLHRMVARADAGDLVDQERVEIRLRDTAFTLFLSLEAAAVRLLDRSLPALRDGTASGTPLDLGSGSYFGGRTPKDGEIDWSRPAQSLYNLVRAVTHPYPGAFTSLAGAAVLVWWAVPVDGNGEPGTVLAAGAEGIDVACGEGALRLLTVQHQGEPELPAAAFALAHEIKPGLKLGAGKGTG